VPATPGRIGRIHLVTVPASDHERSTAFYQALGFELRSDVPLGEADRWIELFPPDGTAGVALVPAPAGAAGVSTGILLTTDDIDAAYARLRDLGVDVDPEIARPGGPVAVSLGAARVVGPTPPMFFFRDPDGNSLLLVQPG
jgi:catechol 2,3-dioxygenase-like lactoylglutathione lyase family enzyme